MNLKYTNKDLMEKLTLEEKRSWVTSSPTKVFGIDPNTQQVNHLTDIDWYSFPDQLLIHKAEAMGKPGLVEIYAKEESTGARRCPEAEEASAWECMIPASGSRYISSDMHASVVLS
ncbi:unnamed protein product [Musa acuminata subsp. malaccensis]|uniref:(wild Malaysian banana) hypothetical protein n=1 Tax=Musa acuminata subsp. malaccensis TaxID=214687 RepID=A0A804IBE3_MUSAM|nr:unnamed protein product [Musa acuminata subsp. malaccensis]